MKRGDVYLVKHPTRRDPKRQRPFVVVSRQVSLDSRFETAICAPIFSTRAGLVTQVPVGVDEGLKHDSAVHCDELVSLPKPALTDYVGSLRRVRVTQLDAALRAALALDE